VHSDGGGVGVGVGATAFSAICLFSKKNKFNYFETRKRLAFKYQLGGVPSTVSKADACKAGTHDGLYVA